MSTKRFKHFKNVIVEMINETVMLLNLSEHRLILDDSANGFIDEKYQTIFRKI